VNQRLQRLGRLYIRHPVYFVTACTHARRPLLADETLHARFAAFARGAPEWGAWVGRYVLMPDHLHLFVALDERQASLSAWMKSLKNALSKTLREQGHPSPHWQKGFFDHLLRSTESYAEKWAYVLENPVRAGLVISSAQWPFAGEIEQLSHDIEPL
jgi:REP element-mobilizing transposase RayT